MTKPGFEPIDDRSIVSRYLKYAADSLETISLYLPSEDLRFTGIVKNVPGSPMELQLEVDITKIGEFAAMKAAFDSNKLRQVRLSFSLNEVYFFANTDVSGLSGSILQLRVLLPVFKLQRREAMRVKIGDGFRCTLGIGDNTTTAHDLSATGTSLLLAPAEAAKFQKKDVIQDVRLKFQKIDTLVNLEVKSIEKGKGEFVKVGFRFLNLPNALEQEIAKEAYLYTRKIWARWI